MTTVAYREKSSLGGMVERLAGDAPMAAFLEIADRCNEVCVHCYQVQGEKGELSFARIAAVLDELAELGVLFLTLSGGEPTLRSDFVDIVRYARERAFAVKIYTNGLSMTPELARTLGELAVQEVQISLYSPRPDAHDWVTRVPGSFEKTTNAVRYLRAEKIAVVVKTPIMKVNENDLDAWIALATSLDADYMVDPTLDPREDGDRTPDSLRVSDDVYVRLHRDPRLGMLRGDRPKKNLEKSLCGACSGLIHMEANGELRPCTQLRVPLGNVEKSSIRDVWEANRSVREIRDLTWNDIHGCRDCDLQPYCGRCFATAVTEGGDALGPYGDACRRAHLNYTTLHGHEIAPGATNPVDRLGVGPYRDLGDGRFETIPDVITPEDDARAAALGWTRAAPSAPVEPWYKPGQLVQIRRPGKRPKAENVPMSLFDGAE